MKSEESGDKIVISIPKPEARTQFGGAKHYYIYSLIGSDAKGEINIQRRYSDFDYLRSLLVKRWPGCKIPSLPSKNKVTSSDHEFIESRRKYLEIFLIHLAQINILWYSEELQLFLKNKVGECQKMLSNLSKGQLSELIYRYDTNFGVLLNNTDQEKVDSKIDDIAKYLEGAILKIQEIRNKAEELYNAQSKYQRKYSKLFLSIFTDYEDKCLTFYNGKEKQFNFIFSKENCIEFQQTHKDNSFLILFEQIKRQKRQIFAFQEAIKGKEEMEKQKSKIETKIKDLQIKFMEVSSGKQTFFSKIRNISKDDEVKSIEKSLQKYKKQLNDYTNLCKIIRYVLSQASIEEFKLERKNSYYQMVRNIAKLQLENIQLEKKFWEKICKHEKIDLEIAKIEIPEKSIQQVRLGKKKEQISESEVKNFLSDNHEEHEEDAKETTVVVKSTVIVKQASQVTQKQNRQSRQEKDEELEHQLIQKQHCELIESDEEGMEECQSYSDHQKQEESDIPNPKTLDQITASIENKSGKNKIEAKESEVSTSSKDERVNKKEIGEKINGEKVNAIEKENQ